MRTEIAGSAARLGKRLTVFQTELMAKPALDLTSLTVDEKLELIARADALEAFSF